ncbi:MAG TPA: S16 family serine protease, partial [Pyrinomonadaceae bacterium]
SRAIAFDLASDFHRNFDFHLHVPEGAIPKDGPSAGVTLATAMASALTRVPVRKDLAMTGEITLRGRVLPVGGIKEKLLAAHRLGQTTVLIPKDNEKDLQEVPEEVLADMTIQLVETIDEVLSLALEDACPTDAGATDEEASHPPVWTTDKPSAGTPTGMAD